MEIILIVTLLVLLFFKWIVFALLALPLKVVLLMKKEKMRRKLPEERPILACWVIQFQDTNYRSYSRLKRKPLLTS